jgi:TPR repeat protein
MLGTRSLALSVVVALSLHAQAIAGPFEDATAAYQRGDFAMALELTRPLAEQGDVRAQFNLATIYYNGRGVKQDHAEAAKWFREAAEQGDIQAQRYLGFMYANGQGVARDDREAVKWYGLAAEQGDADAQVNLGVMYSAARGTSQNYVLAHKWFSLAAERYPASDRQKRQQAMRNTELLESKMTPEQLAEARRLARTWQPKTS